MFSSSLKNRPGFCRGRFFDPPLLASFKRTQYNIEMEYEEIIKKLESLKNPKNIAGMARFGIRIGALNTNQSQFSGANSGKVRGASERIDTKGIVSDEQRRRLPEFARPKGSQKMVDSCVAPPRRINLDASSRRRVLKSSNFLASKLASGSYSEPCTKVFGIPIPELRKIAKQIGKNHGLALKLWDSRIHEARILAGYIEEPEKITEKQFEKWVKDFDSWDVVDQVCSSCLDKTKFIIDKIFELSKRKEEFTKRTAFTLICCLTVHDKKMTDKEFLKFFPLIKKASTDERNFVKKAVNWALRQIGKRNKKLNVQAIKLALRLRSGQAKSEKWIGGNALRELTSKKVLNRIKHLSG